MNIKHRNQKLRRKLFGESHRHGGHYRGRVSAVETAMNDPLPTKTKRSGSRTIALLIAGTLLLPLVIFAFSCGS